jgi:hypothetical protein
MKFQLDLSKRWLVNRAWNIYLLCRKRIIITLPLEWTQFVCFVGPGEDLVFVTIPRLKPGVPSTLNTLIMAENGKPLLSPYPEWRWHREGDCDGITSVFRVQVCLLRSYLKYTLFVMLIFSVSVHVYITSVYCFLWLCSPARAMTSSSHEVSCSHTTTHHSR